MNKKAVGLIAVLVAGLFVGCSKEQSPKSEGGSSGGGSTVDKVRLQLNWVPEPEFGGFYAAAVGGIFAKHNLEVEILKGGPNVPSVQMTASGTVEFGIASADEVVTLRDKGGKLVGLYASYQKAPQGIMAHASAGADSIESLLNKGGKLAVQPGLSYIKFLDKKFGMSKVTLVPHQYSIAPFMADKTLAQQCFVTSEPLEAKSKGAKVDVFLIADTGFNPYTAVVVTNEKLLGEKPDMVKRFVTAVREGWEAYQKDPGPANTEMVKYNESMSAELMAEVARVQTPLVETEDTDTSGLGTMTEARWQELINQLVDLGVVKTAPQPSECFRDPAALVGLPAAP